MPNQFFSTKASRLAFKPETAQANPTPWNGDETLIDHLSIGKDAIAQSVVKNTVLQPRWGNYGERPPVLGTRNVEVPISMYLHGLGEVTAPDNQVPDTALLRILANALGCAAAERSFSRTIVGPGAETNEIEVTDAAGYVVGANVAVEDTTAPLPQHTEKSYVREILAINGNVLTLDMDLPFTVANGDLAHGCGTAFRDQDVLVDSSGEPGRTLAWWVQGQDDVNEIWELLGTTVELGIGAFAKNQPPVLECMIKGAAFRHEDLVAPTWTVRPEGFAPRAIGLGTTFSIAEYTGDPRAPLKDLTTFYAATVEIEPGTPKTAIETVVERDDYMQGIAAWSSDPEVEGTITANLGSYDKSWGEALSEEKLYYVRYTVHAAPGFTWAIEAPLCRIIEYPVYTDVGVVGGVRLIFKTIERNEIDDGADTELRKSRIRMVLA